MTTSLHQTLSLIVLDDTSATTLDPAKSDQSATVSYHNATDNQNWWQTPQHRCKLRFYASPSWSMNPSLGKLPTGRRITAWVRHGTSHLPPKRPWTSRLTHEMRSQYIGGLKERKGLFEVSGKRGGERICGWKNCRGDINAGVQFWIPNAYVLWKWSTLSWCTYHTRYYHENSLNSGFG